MNKPSTISTSVVTAFLLGTLFGTASVFLALRIFLPMLGRHWDLQLVVILFSIPVGICVVIGCGQLFVGMEKGKFSSDDWPVSKKAVMLASAAFSIAVLLSIFA